MNFANDDRLRELNEQIKTERDPQRLFQLVEEFQRLIDGRLTERSDLLER